ncbi:YceH family protein [Psychromonas sp. MME2]|uniref:YceH family protein n=1 Tax=unclassified Psychromonas TaxID=2614957 RepID=UPI00339D20BA
MIALTALQCRVIGVMLEKEITTPDQYPLSLNSLTNGCNQKSNREPVLSLSETQVQSVIDELIEMKQLFVEVGSSGRVNKYKHRFCNTAFTNLQLSAQQKAIICLLFLRGPQTAGELRTRSNRLAEFNNVNEVEAALETLQDINNQQLVKKLPREAGKRESRYIHLFTDLSDVELECMDTDTNLSPTEPNQLEHRVSLLEDEVGALKNELARLTALIESR